MTRPLRPAPAPATDVPPTATAANSVAGHPAAAATPATGGGQAAQTAIAAQAAAAAPALLFAGWDVECSQAADRPCRR